jgi:hypothetical protein
MTLRIHALFTVARPSALLACGLMLGAFTVEAQTTSSGRAASQRRRTLTASSKSHTSPFLPSKAEGIIPPD